MSMSPSPPDLRPYASSDRRSPECLARRPSSRPNARPLWCLAPEPLWCLIARFPCPLAAALPGRLAVQCEERSAVGFECWFVCWTAPIPASPMTTASRPARIALNGIRPRFLIHRGANSYTATQLSTRNARPVNDQGQAPPGFPSRRTRCTAATTGAVRMTVHRHRNLRSPVKTRTSPHRTWPDDEGRTPPEGGKVPAGGRDFLIKIGVGSGGRRRKGLGSW
jgi:hypothetical protein